MKVVLWEFGENKKIEYPKLFLKLLFGGVRSLFCVPLIYTRKKCAQSVSCDLLILESF